MLAVLLRLRLPVLGALAALVLAACAPGPTGDPQTAATVNGETISVSEVERRFESVRENPQLAEQLAADEDDVFRQQVQAQILSQLIQSHLLRQGAEELGVTVTDADVDEKRAEIVEEVGGEDAFEQIVEQNNLTEEDVTDQLRDLAYQELIQEHLTEDLDVAVEEIEAFYAQNEEARFGESARARHILVESEEEAEEALERLDEGEDFAELAEEMSTDPGSAAQGGDLGDFTRDRMVPEFAEAVFTSEPGEVLGPIETEFGFHVIEVTGRQEGPELAEVSDEIREELLEQERAEAVQAWLAEQNQAAEIEVNPRFGEWDAATGQVVPEDSLGDDGMPVPPPGGPPPPDPGGPPPPDPGGPPPPDPGAPPPPDAGEEPVEVVPVPDDEEPAPDDGTGG